MRSGQAEFIVANFEDFDCAALGSTNLGGSRSLFLREPERARSIVERWLTPGGQLFIFFDAPAGMRPLGRNQPLIKTPFSGTRS